MTTITTTGPIELFKCEIHGAYNRINGGCPGCSEDEQLSRITRNEYGAFCSVCQSPLSIEEDDFDDCDVCGREGIGNEE